ncbi:hypothetical protein CRE_11529 [Caenorhabditis remanei]|uniref:F-box associated domain-containing protein n=1 Tax=Caenorhabditis remanei TaxID=31234 RepID=E3NM58_CAERE|nr:hypothetical protein CRE_11529 [Caenorhabditis remanei]
MNTILNKCNHECCVINLPEIDGTLTKSLYEHVKSLYRYTEPCGLEVHMETFTKVVPIYENVNKIFVRGETFLDRKDVNTLLAKYPDVNNLMIEPTTNWELMNTSKSSLKIENVHISFANQFAASLLSKFTGRSISFSEAVITETELNQFIGKWIRSEAYHNLETVNLGLTPSENGLNIDLVFDQLETEAFDATKRPQWYQFSNKLFNMTFSPIDFSGDNCFDVIRESDGKRASILFDVNVSIIVFTFLVWS